MHSMDMARVETCITAYRWHLARGTDNAVTVVYMPTTLDFIQVCRPRFLSLFDKLHTKAENVSKHHESVVGGLLGHVGRPVKCGMPGDVSCHVINPLS